MNAIQLAASRCEAAHPVDLHMQALDQIARKLTGAEQACQVLSELLEAMRGIVTLIEHMEQQPIAANRALMDAVHAQVEANLAALGRLREQLMALVLSLMV